MLSISEINSSLKRRKSNKMWNVKETRISMLSWKNHFRSFLRIFVLEFILSVLSFYLSLIKFGGGVVFFFVYAHTKFCFLCFFYHFLCRRVSLAMVLKRLICSLFLFALLFLQKFLVPIRNCLRALMNPYSTILLKK